MISHPDSQIHTQFNNQEGGEIFYSPFTLYHHHLPSLIHQSPSLHFIIFNYKRSIEKAK